MENHKFGLLQVLATSFVVSSTSLFVPTLAHAAPAFHAPSLVSQGISVNKNALITAAADTQAVAAAKAAGGVSK